MSAKRLQDTRQKGPLSLKFANVHLRRSRPLLGRNWGGLIQSTYPVGIFIVLDIFGQQERNFMRFAANLPLIVLLLLPTHFAFASEASDYISPLACEGPDLEKKFCERHKTDFIKQYPKASAGDYQSQRNIAFCLGTGCDGAVIKNPITSCAWRIVIIDSGSLKIDQSDVMHVDICRRKLSDIELAAARSQSQTLKKQTRR